MKKILSILLAVMFVFSAVPMSGITGFVKNIDFDFLSVKSNAASESDLTFTLNSDGNSYSVKASSTSISGELVIPTTYNGKPVTRIGYYAFSGCSSLTSVTIPNGVISIGDSAFYNCSNLTNITIPDSVTSIGWTTFGGCSSLTSITISNSVTSIGRCAFYNCSSLTSITIPDGVTSIDDYAFYSCSSLISVTIPDNVMNIGGYTFENCNNLTSVIIGNGVTSIGYGAFRHCVNLTSISMGENVTSIRYDSFFNTGYYNNLSNWENGALYLDNCLIKADNDILSGIFAVKKGTKTIADSTFCGCDKITGIIIPKNLTSIGYEAFYGCSNLTSITIPNSVTNIGERAFYHCSKLTSIAIPNSVINIGDGTFSSCSSLTKITIPNSVTKIGSNAFNCCINLTDITISNSVTSIGQTAFSNTGYYNNTSNWKNGVLYIENYLIKADEEINGVCTIKEGTKTISNSAFENCRSLTSIIIPDSVTSIGDSAFEWCNSLANITIPDSVTGIGRYAFYECSSLKSITIHDSVTSIGEGAFEDCDKLVIKCYKNSYAHKYAVDNSIKYELIEDWTNKNSTVKLGSASIQNGSVKVIWSKLSGAESYIVYRKAGSAKTWSKIGTSKTTSYTDKSVKNGTTYKYTVCGVKGTTTGKKNETGISVLYLSAPSTKIANKNGYISVSWGKVTGATGYIVYRKAGSAKSWSKLATISKNSTVTYTDKSVKSGTDYTYCVKAYKGKTTSAGVSTTALKYLSQPKLSKVTSAKAGVTVQWGKVTGASGYVVYRKTGSGKFTKLATVKGNTKVSYLDKSAKKGTTYTYTVQAYCSSYKSAYNTKGVSIKDKY